MNEFRRKMLVLFKCRNDKKRKGEKFSRIFEDSPDGLGLSKAAMYLLFEHLQSMKNAPDVGSSRPIIRAFAIDSSIADREIYFDDDDVQDALRLYKNGLDFTNKLKTVSGDSRSDDEDDNLTDDHVYTSSN